MTPESPAMPPWSGRVRQRCRLIDRSFPLLVAMTVFVCVTVISQLGVVVTSAGQDQKNFHWPSVLKIRADFPAVDIVNLPTATGPVYHLIVAALSGPWSLDQRGTQNVAGLFSVALAILAAWYAREIPSIVNRCLALAPLLLSVYFWQSALWMLTDNAAMFFLLTVLILLNSRLGHGREIAVGIFSALAVATRQTAVWILVPSILVCLAAYRGSPPIQRLLSVIRVALPSCLVLAILIAMWGGLTPPAGAGNANSQSPVSLSFTFAVAAIFFIPVLACLRQPLTLIRQRWHYGVISGTVVSIPAAIFPSSATTWPDDSRRGGPIWSAISVTRNLNIFDRSPVLILMAFLGGFAAALICLFIARKTALIVISSLFSLAFALIFGGQLFQKYAELPIAILVVAVIVALWRHEQVGRVWPLALLAVYQLVIVFGIVGLPIARSFT